MPVYKVVAEDDGKVAISCELLALDADRAIDRFREMMRVDDRYRIVATNLAWPFDASENFRMGTPRIPRAVELPE